MATLLTTAAQSNPGPGRDDPQHGSRADRLVRRSIRAMSTGALIEFVAGMDDGSSETGYRAAVLGWASEELADRFGLEAAGGE